MIDQETGAVTTWKIPGHTNVDALALDEARHRLFAASLQPGRLTVVDTQSGWVVAALPCIGARRRLPRQHAPGDHGDRRTGAVGRLRATTGQWEDRSARARGSSLRRVERREIR